MSNEKVKTFYGKLYSNGNFKSSKNNEIVNLEDEYNDWVEKNDIKTIERKVEAPDEYHLIIIVFYVLTSKRKILTEKAEI